MINEDKKKYNKKYYEEHREQFREYNRKWCEKNKDKVKEYQRKHYQKNKDSLYENNRKWQKENSKRFSKLCSDSRKRRVEKLRSEGVKNAWAVVIRGAKPKYASNNNQES
jgi:hypothetical protein